MNNHKLSLIVLAIICLGASSCSKVADRNYQLLNNNVQTTTRDIIISNNTIPLSAAVETGLNFLQQKNANMSVGLKNAITVVKNGKPYFHIVNANKGFVILSPDSAYVPVLAYDCANNFSFADKDLNPGLKQWFNKHSIEIDFIRNTHNSYTDSIGKENKMLWRSFALAVRKEGKSFGINATTQKLKNPVPFNAGATLVATVPFAFSTYSTVVPLCATQWGQEYPYYQYCPLINGVTQTVTGCVPTAMAQIMYFWKTPALYNFSIMPLSLAVTPAATNPIGYSEIGSNGQK